MQVPNQIKFLILGIGVITLGLVVFKVHLLVTAKADFKADAVYEVTYRYFFKTNSSKTFVKAFLPKNNNRQKITAQKSSISNRISFSSRAEGENICGHWSTDHVNSYEAIAYSFTFMGRGASYDLKTVFKPYPKHFSKFLRPSENIQVFDHAISAITSVIRAESKSDKDRIQAIFDLVYEIPSAPIITLTDAVSALRRNTASCNGKSRLFVALARNLGYPARIKGGIILKESNKRTSHAWAEVFIDGRWVPFDTLNGHFAYLPSNFLELYVGDEFMITHSPSIQFDYSYDIKRRETLSLLASPSATTEKLVSLSLWGLVMNKSISKKNLFLLLMLPLGGLVVALLRNVVGIRTFGVFLPVLIAFSLLQTGFVTGIALFLFLILFVGAISRPFDNMGLLHTPKLVISLTLMVLVMTVGNYLGVSFQVSWLGSLTLFPTIILTISAERFSKLIVEDGFHKATGTLFQTLMAVTLCFLLFSLKGLDAVLILFPEMLFLIISSCLVLGRYVGLRWTELIRFQPLLTVKQS